LILLNLERRITIKQEDLVGDIFQQMAEYFKMYKVYCTSQEVSMSRLDDLTRSSTKFATFLKETKQDPRSRGLSLCSFLIKPVQRLCKYPLFLRELLKNTPSTHPDYEKLIDAKERIEKVVEAVNEGKKIFEAQQKVLEIQSNIDGVVDLLSPARIFLQQGTLLVSTPQEKQLTELMVYLFSDLIILARKKKENKLLLLTASKEFILKYQVPLESARVILCAEWDVYKHIFQIQTKNKTFTLSSINQGESQKWFETIRKIVKQYQLKKLRVGRSKYDV